MPRDELRFTGIDGHCLRSNRHVDQLSDRFIKRHLHKRDEYLPGPNLQARGVVSISAYVFELVHGQHQVLIVHEAIGDWPRLNQWVIDKLADIPSQPVMIGPVFHQRVSASVDGDGRLQLTALTALASRRAHLHGCGAINRKSRAGERSAARAV